MKNILLILISLNHLFVFSQTNEMHKEKLQLNFFTPLTENNQNNNSIHNEIFEDVMKSINITPNNNSEGKFPLYNDYVGELIDNYDISDNKGNVVRTENKSNYDSQKLKSIMMQSHAEFINEIINKVSTSELRNQKILLNQIENKKVDHHYHAYSHQIEHDKLNVEIYANEDISIEIGKNIYKHINKILKTEIDKTLNNSINLLVLNW